MAEAVVAFLLMLGVVLALVTLVGHGIWVLIATIFGGNSAGRRRGNLAHKLSADSRRACPRCLTPVKSIAGTCSVCGWPSAALHSDAKPALAAVREQLNQYALLGIIDEAARDRFLAEIQNEEQLLAERALSAQQAAEAKPAVLATPPLVEAPASELTATTAMPPATGTELGTPAAEPALLSAAPVGERARRFAASRAEAALEPSPGPSLKGRGTEEAIPAVPVSRLLAAFMEEKNIRWGELVGGLLIVGCSIALVISFWSEIAARPLLKFGLFNGVTAALFGAGLYTDRRWKIHTTSHGVLIIATLLVPLNFLAIAAFTQASPPTDLLSLAGEAVSLLVFSLLVYFAGRILLPGGAPLLVAGVMVPSLMQLVVRRFAEPGMPLVGLYALAGVPIASYLVTSVLITRKSIVGPSSRDGPSAAVEVLLGSRHLLEHSLLVFLGLVSAATLLPLALLAYRSPPLDIILQRLSPLVAMGGLPALLVGLVFWRRASAWGGWGRGSAEPPAASTGGSSALGGFDPSHPRSESTLGGQPSAGLQTAGIAVGVLGAMIMLAAVLLAWPEPALLLPTALTLAAVMTSVALWFALPSAYLPAGIALAATWLIGFYLARGDIAWTLNEAETMRQTLVSATSGHALLPLAGIFAALAGWLSRTSRTDDSFFVGLMAAATAAASLGLVMWFGFARIGDPANATWMLAVYTLAALAASIWLNREDIAYASSALLLATLVQAVVYRYGLRSLPGEPWLVWITAVLAHSTLAAIIGGALRVWPSHKSKNAARALIRSAQVTSLVAAAWIALTADRASASGLCVNLAWLAGVWTFLAAVDGSRLFFGLSQIALVLSIICGVTAAVAGRPWYVSARHPWLDPWFLEAQGIALAAYCLLMRGVRSIFTRLSHQRGDDAAESSRRKWAEASRQLLNSPLPSIDDVVEVGLVLLVGCVAIYAALPGAAQELTPRSAVGIAPIEEFELAGIPHIHAANRGAWALVAAVIIALSAGIYQAGASWPIGLLLAASAVCPLLAARWEADLAVASALRWFSAGFFALASIGIWTMSARLSSDGWLGSSRRRAPSDLRENYTGYVLRQARDVLVGLVVLIYVAMGAYVAHAAIYRATMPSGFASLWLYAGLWTVVVAVLAFAIPRTVARKPNNLQGGQDRVDVWLLGAREALLVVAFAPLAVLFTFAVARALDQYPVAGPLPGSWFRRIGWDVSYGVPLAVIALVFIGYAIRERSSGFAFAAGLLFNAVATIVVLLRLARGGGALDVTAWIIVAQVNAIVCGVVALVWLTAIRVGESLRSKIRRGEGSHESSEVDYSEEHSYSASHPRLGETHAT